ncbi:MAG: hypothetical protein ABSC65_24770 [Acidobacteriaceae bacterium]|jgi:hypothetical protein
MSKVKVLEGGTVSQGSTFDWENHTDSDCSISGTGDYLTESSYTVPKKSGTTPGTTSATVQEDVSGDFSYSASNGKKRENPTLHVDSGKP